VLKEAGKGKAFEAPKIILEEETIQQAPCRDDKINEDKPHKC